jgi:N-methylhydantoinase A
VKAITESKSVMNVQNLKKRSREESFAGPLLIIRSSGGAIAAGEAPAAAISTVGSVLTGGVVGAMQVASLLCHRR